SQAPPPAPPAGQPAGERELGENQAELAADYIKRDGRAGTVFAEGNVRVRWRDLLFTGERALFDLERDTLHVDGPIRVSREDGTELETDTLDADLGKYWYTTGAFRATIPPSVIGHGAAEPFYLWGSDTISRRDQYFSAHNATFTSCPPNDLKYRIEARTVAVVPNKKIILRSPKVYLFGVPIFAFGKLVLPLRRYRRTEWLPEFGRNEVYGFYGRYRYFYDLADSQLGNISGTMTERRGMFFGLEHDFGLGRGAFRGDGRLDVEYGTRQAELSARGDWNQALGEATQLRVNGSYSQNSGFSTTSKQSDLSALLSHSFSLGSTSLGYTRSDTSSGGFSSAFTRLNFNQRLSLGPIFGADFSADYSNRTSPDSETDHELETRTQFRGQWTLFDWEVLDVRRFDLEGSRYAPDDNRAVTEIVPQLTLRSDARRIGVPWPELLDLRVETSVGQFQEFVVNTNAESGQSRSTVLRVNFDFDGNLARVAVGPRLRTYTSFRYNQSFFDHPNPAAKYIVAFGPTMEWQPLANTRLDVRYRWQEVSGFSPLSRFDYAQTLNDIDYTFNFFVPDRVRPRSGVFALLFNGGFDLLRGRNRDLAIEAQIRPLDELMMRFNTSYTLEGGFGGAGFRSLRGEIRYDGGPRYRHEVGFNYDARNGIFANVDSLLTVEPLPRVTVQNALTYDGFREKITYNDILVNYNLGCVSLLGTYRQQAKEFRLDLNITAFPGLASLFGTGRFGQVFSTSQGLSY
ncbi:MAG: LPS-assembly protein LptD, partial [Armatimonadetes bacterium]|nr:LPS-assembly protein LptD [Armatimonadota bacterium]